MPNLARLKAVCAKPAVKLLIALALFLACVVAAHGTAWMSTAAAYAAGLILAFGHLDWFGKAATLEDEFDIRSPHYKSGHRQ